jgi:large subunit ribosomal protein L13
MKTTQPKESEVQHAWYLIDATDKPAGRLAVDICRLLRGRGKPDYTPHIDMGDFVVVIHSAKVALSGNSKEEKKTYAKYTRYQGGYTETPAAKMRAKNPNYILWHAVKGMLPKNHLSRRLLKRLKLYPGAEHPHAAQNPTLIG